MVKTKIIATLGPASESYTVIRKMVMAGLDVVRLNFSHANHQQHLGRLKLVRQINQKYRRHIRIMQDLEGQRIRVGYFQGGQDKLLKKKTRVWLVKGPDQGDARIIPFDYQGDLTKIKAGQFIFIDDGNLLLKVKSSSRKHIKAEVLEGGILKERKGINMPGAKIPFYGLTDKDKKDIEFALRHKVDYVAQSFIRSKSDIQKVARLVKPKLPECLIVAKIETRQAIRNIDEIIEASDGVMIARGDMGISIPIYEIPIVQKLIIKKCKRRNKFAIIATQMLEHMSEHTRPTRAEVTDVANAIIDGADFVMLSAETASGLYPYEAVKMMNQIIKFTENSRLILKE